MFSSTLNRIKQAHKTNEQIISPLNTFEKLVYTPQKIMKLYLENTFNQSKLKSEKFHSIHCSHGFKDRIVGPDCPGPKPIWDRIRLWIGNPCVDRSVQT